MACPVIQMSDNNAIINNVECALKRHLILSGACKLVYCHLSFYRYLLQYEASLHVK